MSQSTQTESGRQEAKLFREIEKRLEIARHAEENKGSPRLMQLLSEYQYMPSPEQTPARTKVALIGWGMRHDLAESQDEAVGKVVSMCEKKDYEIVIVNAALKAWSPTEREVSVDDIALWLKSSGIQKAIFLVAKSNARLQEVWGDCSIAGIEIYLVGIEGYHLKPRPCTMRYWKEQPLNLHPLVGKWAEKEVDGVRICKWQEPKWSYEELAETEFPTGSVNMWKPSDYDFCEVQIASKWRRPEWRETMKDHGERIYVRLLPPEGVEYPHKLELKGCKFCEVTARYIDWIVGQRWIYGELAQKLRQWHAHPVIQEELERYKDKEYESQLKSTPSGYWNHKDEYIATGCQNGPSLKEIPVWLMPRDKWGREMWQGKRPAKAEYNEDVKEKYISSLERKGFADREDKPPQNWEFTTPWAFENVEDEDEDIEERNIQQGRTLEEERDFQREAWKQRFPYNREDEKLEIKDYQNAWYTALEVSEKLRTLKEEAKAAETPEEWNRQQDSAAEEKESLRESYTNIRLELTPVLMAKLKEERGPSSKVQIVNPEIMQGVCIQPEFAYRQRKVLKDGRIAIRKVRNQKSGSMPGELAKECKECLAEVQKAARRTHDKQEYEKREQIHHLLQGNPKLLWMLIEVSPDLAEEVLAEYASERAMEIALPRIKEVRKKRAKLFPELYTKAGTRRKKVKV